VSLRPESSEVFSEAREIQAMAILEWLAALAACSAATANAAAVQSRQYKTQVTSASRRYTNQEAFPNKFCRNLSSTLSTSITFSQKQRSYNPSHMLQKARTASSAAPVTKPPLRTSRASWTPTTTMCRYRALNSALVSTPH
jgi:hypothetical protein